MIKQGDFEIPDGKEEVFSFGKKVGVQPTENLGNNWTEWFDPEITIKGENVEYGGWKGIRSTSFRKREVCLKMWEGITEEIPHLKCPYCHSQAFRTDHKAVAMCGACPGWYFFYRRIDEQVEKKTKYIMRNGELVEVEDAGVTV